MALDFVLPCNVNNSHTKIENGKCRIAFQGNILVCIVAEQKHRLKRFNFDHLIFDLNDLNLRDKFNLMVREINVLKPLCRYYCYKFQILFVDLGILEGFLGTFLVALIGSAERAIFKNSQLKIFLI